LKDKSIGFNLVSESSEFEDRKTKLVSSLKGLFKPEFLNRLDDIIVFYPLTLEEIKQIVDIIMEKVEKNVADSNIEIVLTDAARDYLAKTGYSPEYGARPLQRLIEKEVEDPIAIKILQGEIKDGSRVVVDYNENEGIVFDVKEKVASHE